MMALLLLTGLQACKGAPTRAQVDAEAWLNSGLPADLCNRFPEIKGYGLYRKLNNGKYEFISYCIPQARNYTAFRSDKLKNFLDEYLPKQ